MFQLKTLLKTNHHNDKTVSVLSLNIFGAEHDVLPAILNEGGLENVVQLTVSVYYTSGKSRILHKAHPTLFKFQFSL